MQLPPLIGTLFAKAEVKNEVKSVQNLRKHATKSNTSSSLLSFLQYSEQIRTSNFGHKSFEHTCLSTCRALVQFRNWPSLRRLPLLYRHLLKFCHYPPQSCELLSYLQIPRLCGDDGQKHSKGMK